MWVLDAVSLLQDYDVSIRGLASSTLGSILGTYTLSALLSERSSHPTTFFVFQTGFTLTTSTCYESQNVSLGTFLETVLKDKTNPA